MSGQATNPWRIRPAETRDLGALVAIEREQFPDPWTRAMLLDELRQPTRRYSVAVEKSVVIGYLGLMFVMDDEVHVNSLATAWEHEGRGVGRSLLEEGLGAARGRGVRRATLEVAASNERAQKLYAHFGFAPVGVRRRYYERTGEDALVMWADPLDDPPAH